MKFQTNYPIYLQIADDIKRKIVVGELHPGDKLPSNIDLALQYEVNPNTAVRIYKELEQESISFTKRGIGRSSQSWRTIFWKRCGNTIFPTRKFHKFYSKK